MTIKCISVQSNLFTSYRVYYYHRIFKKFLVISTTWKRSTNQAVPASSRVIANWSHWWTWWRDASSWPKPTSVTMTTAKKPAPVPPTATVTILSSRWTNYVRCIAAGTTWGKAPSSFSCWTDPAFSSISNNRRYTRETTRQTILYTFLGWFLGVS